MTNAPETPPDPVEKSLGDQATGADVSQVDREQSLGDQSTTGDALSSLSDLTGLSDDLGDDMPLVDLGERYEIQDSIGKGGMGEVLRALDKRLKRPVAIKRVLGKMARSKKALTRFLTEAQSIAALNHFNIVQIYDYGRDTEGPFIIMELVEGESLQERLKAGPLELEEAVELTCQLCDGLVMAHERGIIHRDIKPANILLTTRSEPKLTDFGLARQQSLDHGQTQAGVVLGTIDFMPPEQRRDARATDARSDLWSLAATLYQVVTGKSPKVIRLQDVPEQLQDVISQALEEDPAERYQDAASLRDALQSTLDRQEMGTQALANDQLVEGSCSECGAINDLARKFCKSCASPLREVCFSCEAETAVWERICGECGSNLPELVAAKRQEIALQKTSVESLRREYRYDEAIDQLKSLLPSDHPRFSADKAWVQETINSLEAEHLQQRKRCQPIADQGREELEKFRFAEAAKLLEEIPAPLRDKEILRALMEAKRNQKEKAQLRQEIKQQIAAKDLVGLAEKATRFLELAPGHREVQKLQQQLRERQKKTDRLKRLRQLKAWIAAETKAAARLPLVEQYLELQPGDEQALQLAQRLRQQIQAKRESEKFAAAEKAVTEKALAYNNRGDSYFEKGEYDQALADYSEAIRLDPTVGLTYYNRGAAYFRMDNANEAVENYTEAIRLDPTLAVAYHNRGQIYANMGSARKALADYTEAIRIEPTFAATYHNRGECYHENNKYKQAIADYSEAIRLDPTVALTYFCRGIAYANMDSAGKAFKDYTEAIRLDPTFALAYNNRGVIHNSIGDQDQAIADYSMAIELDPTLAIAYYNRGSTYESAGYDSASAEMDLAYARELGYKP